jgi:ketosteroid isomerase-like protein
MKEVDPMGQARDILDQLTDAAMVQHDANAAAGCYADDAVVMTPDAGEVRGREGITEYWRQFIEGFPDGRWESINKLEAGDTAVDEGYIIGTNTNPLTLPTGDQLPATGKALKMRGCDIATVQDGKITEHHLYFDELDFMRQLGLTEPEPAGAPA